MVKLYKDLGKTAKKLLNDDYDTTKKSVELKTKTLNGVTYTSKGVLSGEKNALDGNLSIKYKVSGTSMTTKLTTGGALTQEAVLDKTSVKGLKLTALGGVGSKQTLELTGEYVHPHVGAVIKANCLGKRNVTSSITMGVHGITVGAQGTYNLDEKTCSGINGLINYTKDKEHEATLEILNKAEKAKVSYSHCISSDFSVGASFLYGIKDDKKTMELGTKYDVDPETTLKAKMSSEGSVCLSYKQEIRKNTSLTLSTRLNVCKLDKPEQQFGLALAIE